MESIFQRIEDPACSLLKTLSTNPGLSLAESQKAILLMFFSVQAARVPQARDKHAKLMLDCARRFMEELAHSSQFFDETMATAVRHGIVIDPVSQESLRDAVDGGHIFPQVDNNQAAIGIFRLAEAILDAVDGMHYTLWYSDGPSSFVCSDYPVGLFYSLSTKDGLVDPAGTVPPIVTMLTDTIYMPLAHNAALAIHRHSNLPTAQRANERMVAIVNTITISHAQRFICSPFEDFICVLPDRHIGNARQALETLAALA